MRVALNREEVHDSFDRLVGVVRMQRAKTQVAGFSEGHRRFHRLGVANFTDQNHIRRLTQSIFQRGLKRMGVESDLPLGDDRLFMPMHELDWIFNGNNMAG